MPFPHDPWHRIVNVHWPEEDGDDFSAEYFIDSQIDFLVGGETYTCLGPEEPAGGTIGDFATTAHLTGADHNGPREIRQVTSTVKKAGVLSGAPVLNVSLTLPEQTYAGWSSSGMISGSASGTSADCEGQLTSVSDVKCRDVTAFINFITGIPGGLSTVISGAADWGPAEFVTDDDPPHIYNCIRVEETGVFNNNKSYQYRAIFKRSS